jgi:hypothetical protein
LHKKYAAILTIAIFLLSTLAIANPVQAHFTLGNLTGKYPYHANQYDPHVTGFIGYVWPGGGSAAYSGAFGTAGPNANINAAGGFSPGYVSPYPATSGPGTMMCNGAPCPASWYQLAGNSYSPFGAVLAGSTGDLIFGLNSTCFGTDTATHCDFHNWTHGWQALTILFPPEFKIPGPEQIVTSWSNDYDQYSVFTLAKDDRYCPGCTAVQLWVDGTQGTSFTSHSNQFLNFTKAHEWYYVRINGVTAPSIAGKYFFKMALIGDDAGSPTGLNATQFVPVQNWPVLLVKGELDPAIITGTIRFAGYNSTLYGQPLNMSGRVWAQMTTKLDPYTGATVATCASETNPGDNAAMGCTDSVGYFNETALGHYEVEGVAPGIYNLYAEAAGYPQELIASGVQVLRGQSLHYDGYLQPGAVIHGNVYTKHQFGDEPWPAESDGTNQSIKIELYDGPTLSNKPDPSANMVSWSPVPCVAGGQGKTTIPGGGVSYVDEATPGYKVAGGHDAAACGEADVASFIAFPWGGYTHTATNGYSAEQVSMPNTNTKNQDPLGVGPPQRWFVQGGTTIPFHFEFGAKGEYGAPRDVSGEVPQIFATWVNGLTPGRYYVRAWVFRYVQTALDGSTFQEYYFDVTPNEWAGDVTVPLDLRLSSWVNKTVHFHNTPGTISTDEVVTGGHLLDGYLLGADGHVYAFNYTDGAKSSDTCNLYDTARINPAMGNCAIQFWGINSTWIGENYGIPSGTYTPYVAFLGYMQGPTPLDQVSVTLSGNVAQISDHLWLAPGFNLTVYSTDWERPTVPRNWVYPGMHIVVTAWSNGTYVDTTDNGINTDGCTPPPNQDNTKNNVPVVGCGTGAYAGFWFGQDGDAYRGGEDTRSGIWLISDRPTDGSFANERATHFDPGQYSFTATTYGYIQDQTYSVYAEQGQGADIRINLVQGVNVSLDILFKKESIITPTDANMSARVRLFNDQGQLVADYMTSEGVYVNKTGRAAAADGTLVANAFGGPFGTTVDNTKRYVGFNDYSQSGKYSNYLPGGVIQFHVNTAGRAMVWNAFEGTYAVDPVFGAPDPTENGGYYPSTGTMNAGILGSPDYTGGWTAEVDFVRLYSNNTGTTGNYYPPVSGLLMGESYHIIPGTTASSGISLTEDGALKPVYISPAHSMAPNHLGPYSQEGVWQISNAHLSGEASAIFEVDTNGLITGNAFAFAWNNEFRTTSWSLVNVVGASGASWNFYTYDGIYQAYLPPGTYTFTLSNPGYTSQSFSVVVTNGQSGGGQNQYLQQSQVPVPEFSTIGIVAFSALAASLYLLRRRRR